MSKPLDERARSGYRRSMTARSFFLLALVLCAGCTSQPFADRPGKRGSLDDMEKTPLPVVATGLVPVCHDADTPKEEIEAVARAICADYDKPAPVLKYQERWTCRLFTPHRSVFSCGNTPVSPQGPAANATSIAPQILPELEKKQSRETPF